MGCLAAIIMLLSACAGASDAGPSSRSAEPEIAGLFDVGGGREMYLQCTGSGSPTVVLVSGQRGSADDWKIVADGVSAEPVYDQLSAQTRVCSYDRPGTPVGDSPSRSDPVEQPTDATGMVADLHALLTAAEIARPFVVVAHSAGGLAARLYAATYPDEVAGMVLVDALSEGLRRYMTVDQWLIQKPLLRGDIDASIAEYPALEWIDPDASFEQMETAPSLAQMPLIVITADEPIGPTIPALKAAGAIGPEIPDDFGYITDAARMRSQDDLAALVRGSEHITETDSGHNVHYEQPTLVADAIVKVVDLVREGAESAAG